LKQPKTKWRQAEIHFQEFLSQPAPQWPIPLQTMFRFCLLPDKSLIFDRRIVQNLIQNTKTVQKKISGCSSNLFFVLFLAKLIVLFRDKSPESGCAVVFFRD
jgi:hypothetical protein